MSIKGNRSFNNCDVRVVEFKEFSFKEGESGRAALSDSLPDKGEHLVWAGYWAHLHCPKTEDERVSVTSEYVVGRNKPRALKELRQLAGELMCRDCRYSSMSPVQVSIERAKFAEAETERIEAFGVRELAIRELAEKGVVLSAQDQAEKSFLPK